MARRPIPEKRRLPYWLSFALAILLLGGLTAAFVLVVLPQRFVLQTGLRASGISFPTQPPDFQPVEGIAVAPRLPSFRPEPAPAPGAAEAFWERAAPLLRAENYRATLPLFSEHLAAHPRDAAAWREYGIALARTDRPREAEAALERAAALTGDDRARLELARLLRDRDEADRAASLYRQLARERPEELQLRHELAQALTWAERYDAAAAEYRTLLRSAPETWTYRLELARVLYWAGDPGEAEAVLGAIPEEAAEWREAAKLRTRLAGLLAAEVTPPPPEPPAEEEPIERARQAMAEGDLERAAELYRELLEESPGDAALWREWADFLEFRAHDPEGARTALLRSARLTTLEAGDRLRLARLHAWTGREEESLAVLASLLEEDPTLAEAWVLRGDLYRWRGDRPAAARAYRRALALVSNAEGAREGLAEVADQTDRVVATRERPGVGPELRFFRDSDGYRRLDVTGRWSVQHGAGAIVARTGYRRLEGLDLEGLNEVEGGPFGEVELSRWWKQGTLRATVTGGAERLEPFGVEPTFGVGLETWSPEGLSLEAAYRHGPAYPLATTLESVMGTVRADQLRLAARRGFGEGWSAGASGELASVRGGGTENWRLGGGASLSRRFSPALRLGVASQLLGYADAAPAPEARRLYWDPRSFWSTVASLEVSLPPRNGWTAHGAVRPGVALVNERPAPGRATVPQLSTELGFGYRSERVFFSADMFHLRGREGDYNALGFGSTLSVRP